MPENLEKRVPKGNIKFSISLSEEQKSAKSEILSHPFNFILGKAGSGKTLVAVQIALDSFFKREVNKIVITRPTVSNEDNGFLPGSLEEKMEPWLVPIRSNMRKVYHTLKVHCAMQPSSEVVRTVNLHHTIGERKISIQNYTPHSCWATIIPPSRRSPFTVSVALSLSCGASTGAKLTRSADSAPPS